jgi:hypothetical protein
MLVLEVGRPWRVVGSLGAVECPERYMAPETGRAVLVGVEAAQVRRKNRTYHDAGADEID